MSLKQVVAVLAALAALVCALFGVFFTVFLMTFPWENRPPPPHSSPRLVLALAVSAIGVLPLISLLVSLLLRRWRLAAASLAPGIVAYATWALVLYGLDGSIEF